MALHKGASVSPFLSFSPSLLQIEGMKRVKGTPGLGGMGFEIYCPHLNLSINFTCPTDLVGK